MDAGFLTDIKNCKIEYMFLNEIALKLGYAVNITGKIISFR